jgi:hypothetical protein
MNVSLLLLMLLPATDAQLGPATTPARWPWAA